MSRLRNPDPDVISRPGSQETAPGYPANGPCPVGAGTNRQGAALSGYSVIVVSFYI